MKGVAPSRPAASEPIAPNSTWVCFKLQGFGRLGARISTIVNGDRIVKELEIMAIEWRPGVC